MINRDGVSFCRDTVCRVMDAQLGEFGVYDLRVDDVNVCRFEEKLPGVNSSMAILYSAIILVAFGLLFHLVNYIHYKKNWFRSVLEVYDGIRKQMGFEVKCRRVEISECHIKKGKTATLKIFHRFRPHLCCVHSIYQPQSIGSSKIIVTISINGHINTVHEVHEGSLPDIPILMHHFNKSALKNCALL